VCRFAHMLNSLEGLIGPSGDADLLRIMRGTGLMVNHRRWSPARLPHGERP
jgi:hypothetical protein